MARHLAVERRWGAGLGAGFGDTWGLRKREGRAFEGRKQKNGWAPGGIDVHNTSQWPQFVIWDGWVFVIGASWQVIGGPVESKVSEQSVRTPLGCGAGFLPLQRRQYTSLSISFRKHIAM